MLVAVPSRSHFAASRSGVEAIAQRGCAGVCPAPSTRKECANSFRGGMGCAVGRSESTPPRGAEGASSWAYDPVNDAPLAIRASPQLDAAVVEDEFLEPGQRFWVVEEVAGQDGVTFLKLADGRGWAFDSKPGVGSMCTRCIGFRRLIDDSLARAAARAGEEPVSRKYHRLPRRLEDDYSSRTRRVLGSGVTGDVVLGLCRRTRRSVAIKHLDFADAGESERACLAREVELALSVKEGPHIVHVLGVYESHKRVSVVMEHLEGGELFDRLHDRGGQLPEIEAKMAVRQILLGVEHLHRQCVAHRDIKLENVMFEHRGGDHVKLIDFGFAADCQSGRALFTDTVGTPAYMAPEMLATTRGERRSYGLEADLWSVGVLTFALLAGKLPFAGSSQKNYRQLTANITAGRYTLSPESVAQVSEEGRDFMSQLLEMDPEKRPSVEQALAHGWFRQPSCGLAASPSCKSMARSEDSTQADVSEPEDGSETSDAWSQSSGDDGWHGAVTYGDGLRRDTSGVEGAAEGHRAHCPLGRRWLVICTSMPIILGVVGAMAPLAGY